MKRLHSLEDTVLLSDFVKRPPGRRSSRTKAFDFIAETHPASRLVTPEPEPDPEPLGSLLEDNRSLRDKLEAARRRLGELMSDSAALKAERDALAVAQERRRRKLAQLGEEVARGMTDAAELDRLRGSASETTARLAVAAAKCSRLDTEASAREKLIKKLRGEAERAGSFLGKNRVLAEELQAAREWLGKLETAYARLKDERDELAAGLKRREGEVEQRRKEAVRARANVTELERLRGAARETQGRLAAAKAELLKLRAQVCARDRMLEQLRAQAARTSSLVGEKHTLKDNLQAARERVVELESSLAAQEAGREELSAELDHLRAAAEETARRSAAAEAAGFRDRLSARDRTVEQLRTRDRNQADLVAEGAALREKLADSERRAEETQAQTRALSAARDELSAELDRLRGAAEETAARLAAAEAEVSELRAKVSARDRTIERLRIEERNEAAPAAECARLREELAHAEQRASDAEAQMVAMRADRDYLADDLATELLKDDGTGRKLTPADTKRAEPPGEGGA